MTKAEFSILSDDQLRAKAKKMKSETITSALLIGFMIGIIIYSAVKNSIGFFTLIPLYFVYRMLHKADEHKVLKEVLGERNIG